jgi:basic amino acid/polyamine antiporter, APA family
MTGAFIWAELAAILPEVGGQYAYLREAYHPAVAFLYGWVLLLVIQTGGMAAVSITFARYFLEVARWRAPDWTVAAGALAILTTVNCLGVKTGGRTQSLLMVMRIVAIALLVAAGFSAASAPQAAPTLHAMAAPAERSASLLAAMVPVLFAYGGWQTANFIAAEVREPRRNLPRALFAGVAGVITLYIAVNWVCVRALGAGGLAATTTPASAVMRVALGPRGATFIAVAIAISTLGFLSQSILTAPRVYFAMARDGLFFRPAARLHPKTRVPVLAIVLQSLWTMVIAVSGRYEQILNYVVAMDFLFFGLTASTLFIFRRRAGAGRARQSYVVPGHPVTTALFVAVCWLVVLNTTLRYPRNTLAGFGLLVAGIPVYFLWSGRRRVAASSAATTYEG